MTKRNRNKKPGRPKGAQNHEYQTVTCHPTRCPQCDCTETEALPNARVAEVKYCGELPDGRKYTRTTRVRRKCANCGQHMIVVERHFVPSDWPQEANSAETP